MNLISLDKLTAQSQVLKQNFEKTNKQKNQHNHPHLCLFFPTITSMVQVFFCLDAFVSSFVWIPDPAKSFPRVRHALLHLER